MKQIGLSCFRRGLLGAFAIAALLQTAQAQTFGQFLGRLASQTDSLAKAAAVGDYLAHHAVPVVEDSTVHFVYRGSARAVGVAGEMDGWDPRNAVMTRVPGTDLFVYTGTLPSNGRAEYKLWVDSAWILDPLNPRTGIGGFGANSDVWMPGYVSHEIGTVSSAPAGRIDTLWFKSRILGRTHPVFVYTPHTLAANASLPVLLVTDGGDYLSFGRLNLILDSLIASGSITPLIALCIDPRTDLNDPSTNRRMDDYAADDRYLDFLASELTPYIEQRYPLSHAASERVMIGASMGGLIATYAALARPGFFPNCAAQSPAYLQANGAVLKLAETIASTPSRYYLQAGIIGDTEREARTVHDLLTGKGASVKLELIPEGHNWTNWRTHLPQMLEYFFPIR